MNESVPPHDLEAERAVLGGIVLDNPRLNDACEQVQPGDFYRAVHRRIFAAMVDLGERRDAIDLLTLRAELARTNDLEAVGGSAYLSGLTDGVPRSTNVLHYAALVKKHAQRRRLIAAATVMLTQAQEAQADPDEVLEDAEKAILGLADRTAATGFESMQTIAARSLEVLDRAFRTRTLVSGVPSGFTDLDAITRGFQPGTLVVVGARPGMGKTSLGVNIARHAATAGHVVANFSLEMSNDELFVRQLAAVAGIDSHRLQSGYIGEAEWSRLSMALGTLAELSIYNDATPAIATFAIKSRLRRLKAEKGLDLVVIDYLQLMASQAKRETRALEIAGMTGALKSLARELNVPILLLAQLNRESAKDDRVPRLTDLRDSGSIEQDADVVLFLHRRDDDTYAADGGAVVELIIAKHRNGPTGSVKLSWHDRQTRFANYTEVHEAEDRRLPMGER